MGIKSAVKEWMNNAWDKYVKQPIANKTIQMEKSASEQINKYSSQAQEQIKKPFGYYWNQDAFYRGLFWIALAALIVLWIISGS